MKHVLPTVVALLLASLAALHAAAPAAKTNSKSKRAATANNVSKVPKYSFATTLEEQERQLAENPLLERFRASRKELLKDPHFPRFHFVSPENRLNDPNGLCFWQGRWHPAGNGTIPPNHRIPVIGHVVEVRYL